MNRLAAKLPPGALQYQVHVAGEPEVNALAIPGGHVVVYEGLLKEAASENELAMVLGHELGHFQNRDHLRKLGRGLVAAFIANLLGATDTAADTLLTAVTSSAHLSFSRDEEFAADKIGLELVSKVYGHAGGATDFFTREHPGDSSGVVGEFFSTHPLSKARFKRLQKLISKERIPVQGVLPYRFKR
jgi:Zn-dependent protease with chaperone function